MRRIRRMTLSGLIVATAACLALTTAGPAGGAIGHRESSQASQAALATTAIPGVTSEITGTWQGRRGSGVVAGTFTPDRFKASGQLLQVRGILDLTLTDANGTTVQTVNKKVWRTVASATAAGGEGAAGSVAPAAFVPAQAQVCDILHLNLGPLHLDLLGLVIDLDEIVLDIVAVPGAGNLLGNLLCAVVGLLDGGFDLGLISDLLNAILAILEGLGAGAAAPASVTT
jgi:hypothetical protein